MLTLGQALPRTWKALFPQQIMPLLFDMVSILQTRKLRLRDIREVEYGLWIQGRALFHSTCQSALYKTVSPLPSAWFPTSSINCIGYFLSFTPTSLRSSTLTLTWIQNSLTNLVKPYLHTFAVMYQVRKISLHPANSYNPLHHDPNFSGDLK